MRQNGSVGQIIPVLERPPGVLQRTDADYHRE